MMTRFFALTFAILAGCWNDMDGDGIPNSEDCNPHQAGACPEEGDTDTDIDTGEPPVLPTWYQDADNDGYGNPAVSYQAEDCPPGFVDNNDDCDDSNASVNPGATEVCDGLDNDCDSEVDEGVTSTFYADDDGDNFGDTGETVEACAAPEGYVSDATDCDDADSAAFPGNQEVCDEVDNDCDGTVDEDDAADATTWYADADSDSYGDAMFSIVACDQPTGYVADSTDCNDAEANAFPGNTEVCDGLDNNCDSTVDEDDAADATTWYLDADGDGYGDVAVSTVQCYQPTGYVSDATDCDDSNASVNPGATEVCNGLDDDCNGSVDGSDATDIATWYADTDDDGYGDSASPFVSCAAPVGYVSDATDCDDAESRAYPGNTEVCDEVDNDCDGTVDEADAADATVWYLDADGDGYGLDSMTVVACEAPTGYAAYGSDCDDSDNDFHPSADESDCADPNDYNCDGSVGYMDADSDGWAACEECNDADPGAYPAAPELCNEQDDDCDGVIDEGAVDAPTWYYDADSDGYGSSTSLAACGAPVGYVSDATDCDDEDSAAYPGATEVCDEVDNDCDGIVDEDDAADATTWYADADSDGYGDVAVSTVACDQPMGYVADGSDCDDSDSSVFPGATEYCDSADNDCDGVADDGVAMTTWYLDADSDSYGNSAMALASCSIMSGYVVTSGDCDDSNASVNPGATEVCDGVDNDCDGVVDDACVYYDADGDGYSTVSDCDDSNASVNPAAEEVCGDGLDNDCDGSDLSCDDVDDDSDGETENEGDCDDSDPAVSSGAAENCADSVDNNCDGLVDYNDDDCRGYVDADGDGYASATDCDDSDASVNPQAADICEDGVDQDCDGADLDCGEVDADSDGYIADQDCDETNPDVHPDAEEVCGDGLDNDCDGSDLDCDYVDDDSDGYSEADGDCDDADSSTYPGASEVCYDSADNDCDGAADNGCPAWDEDGDGYSTISDCDDTDASIYPGAPEVANSADDDCDGEVDEGTDVYDDDSDGYSEADGDCDDADASVSPAADEYCDEADNDCDGSVDEAAALDASAWYADEDEDGYGEATVSTTACDQPSGYVADATDCDDNDNDVYPGATDVCGNGEDEDCDGSDEVCPPVEPPADTGDTAEPEDTAGEVDADGDGYAEDEDCNDDLFLTHPLATEACADGVDNDCDGSVDEDGCVGEIACVLESDGTLSIGITGSISLGLMLPFTTTIVTVGVTAWETGSSDETAYLGDGVEHSLTIYPASNFTPYASDGTDSQWFDLTDWEATGPCLVAEDGLGGYMVEYE